MALLYHDGSYRTGIWQTPQIGMRVPGDADGFSWPRPRFGDSFDPATLDRPGGGMELLVVDGGAAGGKGRTGGPRSAAGRDQGAGVVFGAGFAVREICGWVTPVIRGFKLSPDCRGVLIGGCVR